MKIISIIIPVYNEERFVGELLAKVGQLDFSHLGYDKELIIVNDGSKDNSEEIINQFIAQYE
ncbi:glycosyltransferase [Patescibacteria group bacterium]|nr:glycosyltransferase [Patescibacteria group bacterium]